MAIRRVLVELGGQERELRFGLGAWAALGDHGLDIDQLFTEAAEGRSWSFRTIQRVVWAMLQTENGQSPTMEQVGYWVDGRNLSLVTMKMREALQDAMPVAETTDPPPGAAGIGASPGGSPSAPSDSNPMSSGG